MGDLRSAVGQRRKAAGLSQDGLARTVGISRQALSAIESGASVPSTAIALRLGRALGCAVEELFALDAPSEIEVQLAEGAARGGRAVVARVDGRWVAHPVAPDQLHVAADAELFERDGRVHARTFDDAAGLTDRILLAGCDPAMGLLAAAAARAGVDVAWIGATSHEALGALARRESHVGGAHLYDPAHDEHNVPFVRRALAGRACAVVELARTEEGLVVANGNPRGIRGVEDLAREDVCCVNRPLGAEARALLDRELSAHGISSDALRGYDRLASGHEAVARAVSSGQADAGIATHAVAVAHGLDFVPLHAERFDLVVPLDQLELAPVRRLMSVLHGLAFRRQLAALGGYDATGTGREVART